MTYKQIEASREARLWIGQVIVPVAIGAMALFSHKEVRTGASNAVRNCRQKIKTVFKRD